MTVPNGDTDAAQSRAGALEALLEVAQEADIVRDYPRINAAFERDDYEQIIRLAWRNQFDDDRTKFKRDLRTLHEQIGQRVVSGLEATGE